MIKNAKKNIPAKVPEENDELIHINKKINNGIKSVCTQKCKHFWLFNLKIVIKSKVADLLKRSF